MCGVAGFWSADRFSGEAVRGAQDAILGAMLRTIAHRGPDGEGRHLDEGRGLAMGHVRLAVIDMETGAQPLYGVDGRLVLTANAELYDYKQARARLQCRGHRFATRSDCEIALPLYLDHELDFVTRLRGEFAIALFDKRSERLVLARDRFGVRPLYYAVVGDTLLWGSEAKAIFAHPDFAVELDPRAALGQMMNLVLPGTSAFVGVRQVRPGHVLVAERNGAGGLRLTEERYWDLRFARAESYRQPLSDERAIELVRHAFIDSVRTRLEADVPVGCYLSGGIDSCSILGMASALQQSPVRAFTLSFDDDRYDEAAEAREMAESVGAQQTVLSMDAADLYGESYVRAVVHAERSFYNPFSVAKLHLSRAVREGGYRVVITGEGSDELFAGYPFFKQDLLRYGDGSTMGQLSANGVQANNAVFRGATISAEHRTHDALEAAWGMTPAWVQPWMATLDQARALLAPALRDELASYDPIAELAEAFPAEAFEGRHPLDRAQYTYIKTLHESQVLGWSGDRMDMASAVESRPAFLDHHLAETAAKLPPAVRIRNGVEKWVLREAMKQVLPKSLYERRKFAFMAPPSNADQDKAQRMSELQRQYLDKGAIEDLGFFSSSALADFLAQPATSDPVQRKRNDVIRNCLLGIHILHRELRP